MRFWVRGTVLHRTVSTGRTASPSIARFAIIFVTTWTIASSSFAQDSHYWTLQFGNRARLLGGSVIGSATDLSAVYYNPGFIAWIDEPELLLSGTVFQYSRLGIGDALGPGEDLDTGRFSLNPSLFAGEIRSESLGENRIAYAILTRQESEFRVNERADVTELFQAELPELSFVSEGAQLDSRLTEYWIGGSWSRKLGDRLAIGVSPFVVVRNHRFRAQSLSQALAGDGGGIGVLARDFDYQHWRMLAKIGLATEFEKWQIGATMTTPSAGLFGSGTTGFDQSLLVTGAGATVSSDFQEGVGASYRSPLSFGFGAARAFGRSRLHASVEWFDSVPTRTIMEPEPFQSPSTGETIRNDVLYQLDSVVNFGIGVEHRFENDIQLYTSFRTDFSAAPADSDSNSTYSSFDLFHLAGGATFILAGSEFTLGGVYAFGDSQLSNENLPFGRGLGISFKRLTFIVGVSLLLGN